MLQRWALFLVVLMLAAPARAVSYSDLWWNPDESGWGVQIAQSGSFQFLTLYVYGSDGKPTWYTAELNADGVGTYSGTLYANTGTYFSSPWDPARVTNVVVGTASFQPDGAYHGTLVYTLAGLPPVTKAIVRQNLTPLDVAGNYSGSVAGTVTGCNDPANNVPEVRGRFGLVVVQNAEVSARLTFTFVDVNYAGVVCTLRGPLTHYGGLYRMGNAEYTCTGKGISPGTTSANLDRFHPTQQGIEGFWTAAADGCTQSISFSAVKNWP